MAEIGKNANLEVLRKVSIGFYLDADNLGAVLLPQKEAPRNLKPGDFIDVFLYKDSEDRPIATTTKPYAQVGEFASLEVISKETIGAFLDWGLPKNILLPYSEQKMEIKIGFKYIVYIYQDNSGRIAASTKLNKFLKEPNDSIKTGDEVNLLISKKTDLGWNAIINNLCTGMLYNNEIFSKIKTGDKVKGYIKKIRDDGKIDLTLNKPGYDKIEDTAELILQTLKQRNGKLYITDKSDPQLISDTFGCSKKVFKKAVGKLYKEKLIKLEEKSIVLV